MWKDISSYSKSDTDREPNTFELRRGTVRIVIVRDHIAFRGTGVVWVMRCDPWFNTHALKATDLPDAKAEALSLVAAKVDALYNLFHRSK